MKDEISPDLRQLLDGAGRADDPTAVDRERVRAALVASLATGAGAAGASASAGGKLGLMGRVGLVALVGALLAGGIWWLASSRSGERAARVVAPEPAPDPAPVPVEHMAKGWNAERPPDAAPIAHHDAAPAITTTRAPQRPQPKTRDAAQLAEEARILREAETARRGGDIAQATRMLDEHRRRFPRGALATEREAARILVLCDAGRSAEAKKLAARFLRRYPRSPLADRVRSACESIP